MTLELDGSAPHAAAAKAAAAEAERTAASAADADVGSERHERSEDYLELDLEEEDRDSNLVEHSEKRGLLLNMPPNEVSAAGAAVVEGGANASGGGASAGGEDAKIPLATPEADEADPTKVKFTSQDTKVKTAKKMYPHLTCWKRELPSCFGIQLVASFHQWNKR